MFKLHGLPASDMENSRSMKQLIYIITVLLLSQSGAAVDRLSWYSLSTSQHNSSFNDDRIVDTLVLLKQFEHTVMRCTIPVMLSIRDVRAVPDWR